MGGDTSKGGKSILCHKKTQDHLKPHDHTSAYTYELASLWVQGKTWPVDAKNL